MLTSKARNKLAGPVRLYLTAAMLVFGLATMLLAGCSRGTTVGTVPTQSATGPRPAAAGPASRASLPARLPDASALPAFVDLELVGSDETTSSSQRPAYLIAELSGRELSSVSLAGGSVLDDGRRRLFFHQPIDPDPTDDDWPGKWVNGIHELVQAWDFMGDFLWDGQRGDFAVLWTSDQGAEARTVHGRYRPSGSDTFEEAVLVVNPSLGRAEEVVKTATGEVVPLQAGDEFQLTNLVLDGQGNMSSEAGTTLSFAEGGHLAFTRRPAPSGTYFLGISAESAGGQAEAVYASFQVNNDSLLAGYRAYLDADRGYQLLYPESWPEPQDQGGRLLFADPAGTARINVSAHPDMANQPIVDLKQRALAAYGDVSVLYEDQVEIGPGGGLRTVYGYSAPDGPRTGVLLAFSYQGMAYLVDVDGPASEEAWLLQVADVITGGWTGRAVVASGTGRWVEADVDGLAVQVPADHRPQMMTNGWQRFSGADDLTFLAMRSEPAAGRGLFSGLEQWLDVAGDNVLNFAASEVYAQERGAGSWARIDFEYELETGQPIGGAIMLTRIGERFLILWAESPLAQFEEYEAQVIGTVVDDISRERSGAADSG